MNAPISTASLSPPVVELADLAGAREALVRDGRPAVIRGLLDGQFLAELTDIARVRDALGDLPVTLSRNYVDSHLVNIRNFVQGVNAPIALDREAGTLGQYLDLVESDPETRRLVSEQPTPQSVLDRTDLSALGITELEGGYGNPFAPASPGKAHSLLFAANRGNASDLHTDWDGRDVVLYQLFGRKRIMLFPPEAAPKLHPIDIFSTLKLTGLDEGERRSLLAYASGVEHLLAPGDAIFMPAFWWHHVDYLDAAMSISFRFAGVQDPDAMALVRTLHRDQHVQGIVAGTRDPARAEACRAAARSLREASEAFRGPPREKYRAMRTLAAERHRATLPPGAQAPSPIVAAEDFLDGALCAFYRRPPAGSNLRARLWGWRERGREALRRLGRRIAYRA